MAMAIGNELDNLLRSGERDRVEFKPSLSQAKEIRQTICAFANDLPGHGKPGYLVIGLENDGSCSHLTVDDPLQRKVADIRGEGNILPIPSMDVAERTLDGCSVVVVTVHPAQSPPVTFRGSTWVRVGPSNRRATAEDERRLREKGRAADLPFELQPAWQASISDLDIETFRRSYLPRAISPEVLAENRRSEIHQLQSLHLATTGDDPRPTVLGVLVLGRDPAALVPGAYIQYVRFAGLDPTTPVQNEKTISGPLDDLFSRLDEVLDANNPIALDFTSGPVETRHQTYPPDALRQVTRNAVMHRTYEGTNSPIRIFQYEDRLEVSSPGGPYGRVTVDNFGRPGLTDYRNLHLAAAMNVLGYVQQFGVGLEIVKRSLQANGNPPPEFEPDEHGVLVTLREAAS
jgi:ATP-dependent DNA helicase RecG